MRGVRAGAAFVVVGLMCSTSARAQSDANKSQARELGEQAIAALDHKDWANAETLFLRADSLYHAATLLLGAARAEAHLGKFVEAWENYHRITIEGALPGATSALLKAVDDANAEIDAVRVRRARVTLDVKGGGESVRVTLDGATIPAAALGLERPINPGKHVAHAEAAGFKAADASFSVDEGKSAQIALSVDPDPDAHVTPAVSAPPVGGGTGPVQPDAGLGPDATSNRGSLNRTLGFVGLGVGAAGIVTGVVTGAIAIGKHGDLSKNPCSSGPCDSTHLTTYTSDLSSYRTVTTIATVGFVAGLVAAGAGAVLLFTAPKREAHASTFVTPYVGLGAVGALGTF